ncbi:MAG: response regulator transcription factor, partial [Bdellovibrionales bacterium]|nr:response regulator transcription factor [Bdellovibrionales bacterium]
QQSNSRFVPVLMISGDDEENAKVTTLEVGADDYVVKPLNPRELVARVNAVLRRVTSGEDGVDGKLSYEGLDIDLKSHRVLYRQDEVYLTLTEFKILVELVKEQGRVLSRDILRKRALGNLNVTDRTIDVHMASLRKKITLCADSIKTIRGVGYRFA